MLTPEELDDLKPELELIRQHLDAALNPADTLSADDVSGHYVAALVLMEEVVDRVAEAQGPSVTEALKRVAGAANSAEGAGVVGGVAAAASSLAFTGVGGFGLAAGGTAVGVTGLAGAAVASGGAALAGAAALYLVYKGGSAAIETDLGQRVLGRASEAGRAGAEQAAALGKRTRDGVTEGVRRIRNTRIRIETKDDSES